MAAELLLTFAMKETLKRVSCIDSEGIEFAWGLEGQLRNSKMQPEEKQQTSL